MAQSCLTLCDPMDCRTPGFPVLHYLLEFAQTHVHWVDDVIQYLIICCPLLLLPSIFPSIRIFSNESVLHIRCRVLLELQLQHQSFQRIFRTDFFRIDWFDLLATQVTLKSLLQHYSSEASILWHSAFFMVQLSYPYTAGKPQFPDYWKNHSFDYMDLLSAK